MSESQVEFRSLMQLPNEGTQDAWNSVTIPVPFGLIIYAPDTGIIKIGDGETIYENLPDAGTIFNILAMSGDTKWVVGGTTISLSETTLGSNLTLVNGVLDAIVTSNGTIIQGGGGVDVANIGEDIGPVATLNSVGILNGGQGEWSLDGSLATYLPNSKNNSNSGTLTALIGGGYNEATTISNYGFIGGGKSNTVNSFGGIVLGGETNKVDGVIGVVLNGSHNDVASDYGVVLNGSGNYSANHGVVGNGTGNTASGYYTAVLNGISNSASNLLGVILNGISNVVDIECASVINGKQNTVNGAYGVIVGGRYNTASSNFSAVLEGQNNNAYSPFGVILNGVGNQVTAIYGVIGNGFGNILNSGYGFIGNGNGNQLEGGSSGYGFIGSGIQNKVLAPKGFIGNGSVNTITAGYGVIVGGKLNTNNGVYGSILGGKYNKASDYGSSLGGRYLDPNGRTGFLGFTSSKFSTPGDAQMGWSVLTGVSTTTSAITLTSTNISTQLQAGDNNIINLASNSAMTVDVDLVATASNNTYVAAWKINALLVKTGSLVSDVALIGSPVITNIASTWTLPPTISLSADTINGGIDLVVTPSSTINTHWVAKVSSVEVGTPS